MGIILFAFICTTLTRRLNNSDMHGIHVSVGNKPLNYRKHFFRLLIMFKHLIV